MAGDQTRIAGVPLTRHWLIPQGPRPKVYTPHPTMAPDEIRRGTQRAWSVGAVGALDRAPCRRLFTARPMLDLSAPI
jgi:hypothetical protein